MNTHLVVLCLLVAMALAWNAPANAIENETTRAESDGRTVRLSVRDGSRWVPLLESVSPEANRSALDTLAGRWVEVDGRLVCSDPGGAPAGSTTLSLGERPGHVRLVTRVPLKAPTAMAAVAGQWRFLAGDPDAVWTPNLTPQPGQVIGQHAFRSPAVVVQAARRATLLLPDVRTLGYNPDEMPATLNLFTSDPDGPRMEFALQPHHVQDHVFWRTDPGATATVGPGELVLAYDLLLTASAEPRRAFRLATRWWWEEQGRHNLRKDTLPQAVPWKRYVEVGYDSYLPIIWRETTMNGEAVGGAAMPVLQSRNATWFQCWFNDLRSAYGAFLWGQWTSRPGLVDKARKTRQLLLNAPQKQGLFPVIYDWDRQRWLGSSGPGVGGGETIYHPVDCAWAAYWLLMWHRDLEPSPRSVEFARRLGDWMVRAQKPSGEIPAYIHVDTMEPTGRLDGGAESAGCGMFLALLGRTTGERAYLDAAHRVAAYLRREIIPTNKWHDYETFYSCSRKPETFYDAITGQHAQNNLSIHWAAELFRQLTLADGRNEDLQDGEAMMDYLNLYQQVWAPPFLTFEAFGGFGVQNTDAEWNDARQAQFACTNLDYYRLTGKPEYLERGIAAIRAGFATTYMPENAFITPRTYARTPLGHADENYGHGGVDAPAGPTSWDWGTGSALTAAAYARRSFGDVWVHNRRAWGINGVNAALSGEHLNIETSMQTVAPVLVRGEGDSLPGGLVVDGKRREILAAEWKTGFLVTPTAVPRIRHRAPAALTADDPTLTFEVWPHGPSEVSIVSGGHRAKAERVSDGVWRAALPWLPASPGERPVEYSIRVERDGRAQWSRYRTRIVSFPPVHEEWAEAFTGGHEPSARWKGETPTPGARIASGANGLTLSTPSDRLYDLWVPQNDAPRILTPLPDGDWAFTVAMDMARLPRRGNAQAGVMVELGDHDFAMFGPFQGTSVTLERSGHNGLAEYPFTGERPHRMELRVRAVGETLWFDWRPEGGAWSQSASLSGRGRRAGVFLKTWEALPAEATLTRATLSVPQR